MKIQNIGNSIGIIVPTEILKKLEWNTGDKIGFDLTRVHLILTKLADQSRTDQGRFVILRTAAKQLVFRKKGLFEIMNWNTGNNLEWKIKNDSLFLRRMKSF